MKRLVFALAVLLVLGVGTANAERPTTTGVGLDSAFTSGDLKVTPEMWFYDQAMRRYNDPKAILRAKAEYRTLERQRRLESMRWFGMSNGRPRASSDPFHSDYSPMWVSNPGYYPWRWNGVAQASGYVGQ
jgi:hypothetical protein